MSKKANRNTDINNFDFEKLHQLLIEKKRELLNLRFQHSLGELKNTSLYSKVKKYIARLKTEINKRIDVRS